MYKKSLLNLLAFSLPLFPPHWHGKLTILFCLVALFQVNIESFLIGLKENRLPIFSGLVLLGSMVGLIYSTNLSYGYQVVETLLPLVAIPVAMTALGVQLSMSDLRQTIIFFVAGVITLNLASLWFISYDLWDPHNLQSNLILANNHIVQIHPAFLSLYISLSIFFMLDVGLPLPTSNRAKTGWILFGLIVLTAYLIWLNSRAGILSFLIAAIFFVLYRYKGAVRLAGFAFLSFVVSLLAILPFSRARFFTAPVAVFSQIGEHQRSSDPNVFPIENRLNIYQCSIQLLNGRELFFGYGTGDGKNELQNCLSDRYPAMAINNYDAHNEYFAQMHRHGIVGLALFLLLLGYVFWFAMTNRSPLLAAFIILFAVTALFENVFSAQKGATFFALLCPILMLFARHQSKTGVERPVV